jgi:hypothetical protein
MDEAPREQSARDGPVGCLPPLSQAMAVERHEKSLFGSGMRKTDRGRDVRRIELSSWRMGVRGHAKTGP